MIGLNSTLGEYLETLDYARTRNAVRLAAAMRGVRSLSEPLSPASIASLDNLTEDADFVAHLGDAYAGFNGELGRELHNVLGVDLDDGEDVARCVVCSEPVDYCAGHGEDYARDLARLFRTWLGECVVAPGVAASVAFLDLDAERQSDLIAEWVNATQDAIDYDGNVLGEWLEANTFDALD